MDYEIAFPEARQPLRFSSTDFASPAEALERFRQLTEPICDVTVYGDLRDFHVASSTLQLNGALLIESVSSALRYDRTQRHVAGGIDHFHVALYLAGGAEFLTGDRMVQQRAGDVAIIDMARPSTTLERQSADGTTRVMTVLMPGMMLAPLVPPEVRPAIRVWRRETAYGRMVGDVLLALKAVAAGLSQQESQAAVQSLVHLIAGGLSAGEDEDGKRTNLTQEALRSRLLVYIETNLTTRSLGIETLCRAFDLSRAGLYRLLAPHTPAGYIQERRLQRAFAMLRSPAFKNWRILDIALECQFSNDASFIRAFRRRFGVSPGDARRRLERGARDVHGADDRPLAEPDAEAVRWITQLTGTLLPTGKI